MKRRGPRQYDVRYRLSTDVDVTIRVFGNTRRSAEGWARIELRQQYNQDPARCRLLSIDFATSQIPRDQAPRDHVPRNQGNCS